MANCFLPEEYYYSSWNDNNTNNNHIHDLSLNEIMHNNSNNNTDGTTSMAPDHQYQCYYPMETRVGVDGFGEDRSLSASRSHSEAEKRRRDRINAQLSTLRKLIPKSEKMDKAALLGHVVEHIKEQSVKAKELSSISTLIPTEHDEVVVDDHLDEAETSSHNGDRVYVKASICCDDRPDLFAELSSAVKGLGMTVSEAEITSLGGRMKSNLILCGNNDAQNPCRVSSLKQSLKLVLSRVVMSSNVSNYSARSKRQRFFYPNYSY